MSSDRANVGRVFGPYDGDAYHFLNTLTINKICAADTAGAFSVVDHRVPAGYSPPPHVHHGQDEAFYVIDGQWTIHCGDDTWTVGPGDLVFLPRDIPHGFEVSQDTPGRSLIIVAPGGFDEFVAALGEATDSRDLPVPVAPDPARIVALAAAHGITILPPPEG